MAAVSILSGSLPPEVCGVGDYTACLHAELSKLYSADLLHIPIKRAWQPELFAAFEGPEMVHVQYPTEGWGNSVLPSLMPLAKKRTKLLLTLHEWSQMNPLRRASIRPLIAKADGFLFVSELEQKAFAETAPRAALKKPSWVVPIGVNVDVPELSKEQIASKRTELTLGRQHPVVITHFGFIHAGKQPEKLLDTVQALQSKGKNPRLIFIGDFQKDKAAEKHAFQKLVEERGLTDKVQMMGFVKDEQEAALTMAAADVSISLFSDGLTPRRGSFWYATQHGRPTISTEPTAQAAKSFGPLERYLRDPWVRFVSPEATGQQIADAVDALPEYEPKALAKIPVPTWRSIAEQHVAVYQQMLGRE